MSDVDIDMTLWCLLKGTNAPFPVTTSSTTSIAMLKELIKGKKGKCPSKGRCIRPQALEGVLFLIISTLWKTPLYP